jgi:hypothetical protein
MSHFRIWRRRLLKNKLADAEFEFSRFGRLMWPSEKRKLQKRIERIERKLNV